MSRKYGGYIGNTPAWGYNKKSGAWSLDDVFTEMKKETWPDDGRSFAMSYILRNLCNRSEQRSFDSGIIHLPRLKGMFIVVEHNSIFSSMTSSPGTGNANGYPGKAPAGALWLIRRTETIVTVASVNGSGGVTSVDVQKEGIGSFYGNGSAVAFTGGSGTGVTLFVSRTPEYANTVTGVSATGSGYTVGDTLRWTCPLPTTGGHFDSNHDTLIHGVGGDGGPGNYNNNGGSTVMVGKGSNGGSGFYYHGDGRGQDVPGGAAGEDNGALLPSAGSGGGGGRGGGGGGGAGWGGGQGGQASGGDGGSTTYGSGGGAGFSRLNTTLVTNGLISSSVYPEAGISVTLEGTQLGIVRNQFVCFALV